MHEAYPGRPHGIRRVVVDYVHHTRGTGGRVRQATVMRGADTDGSKAADVSLAIEVHPGDGETVIRLAGELDVSTSGELREVLERVDVDVPAIVLDVSDLTFVDSTGIGCLFKLERRAADAGGMVVVRHPQPQIHRVMEMTQLNRIIAIVTD
jgi:anti-anti-sigma factor